MSDIFDTFSLYIHLPWCLKKCPYCDFNSHTAPIELPEKPYLNALFNDLFQDAPKFNNRRLKSIFFGGGTPSLFSAEAIHLILQRVNSIWAFEKEIEITLEANPGTFEQAKFAAFRQAGINRLSIGVQSFQNDKLKHLGRVHDADQAMNAVEQARQVGFENINIDLMHGLPEQTLQEAMLDLTTAFSLSPTHISWYQLTIEPNTVYAAKPPVLPNDEHLWEIQENGQNLLEKMGYEQYEVSAYAKNELQCVHNLNYWNFGDYLGIGAGAHSKVTLLEPFTIERFSKLSYPRAYLSADSNFIAEHKEVAADQLPFEFMLNAMRLKQPVTFELFEQRTGLKASAVEKSLEKAANKGLLTWNATAITLTALGWKFMNEVLQGF